MSELRKGNKELIKDINRYTVLNLIREKGEITRTEIAKRCDFGMSTLTYILEDLQASGFISEGGEVGSTGGRRAKVLTFNRNFAYIASVKIEEERILLALTDLDATVIIDAVIAFPEQGTPEEVAEMIMAQIHVLLKKKRLEQTRLMGIGIAVSGLVNRKEGVVIRSTMLGWENVELANMFAANFPNIPVLVDKNINCYAQAELFLGEGRNTSNFVCISIGAGLGLSTVINRHIYYGSHGGAGEFGHTTFQVDGYPCHCGQDGCLEMYASEFYFHNQKQELLEKNVETTLTDFHFENVAKAAENGDKVALQLIQTMGENLGYGIRNLINTFNPEKVIIAGEGLHHADLFIKNIQEIANRNFFSEVAIETQITETSLGDLAWLQGAALLVINQIFQVPIYESSQTLLK
ncbi:ROK family transcriptional regulator [Listeria booriae]|uniref:ROK family transcriptional regulator n=1 Tax=Listeria booriae TaxID=1552123 RepID=UPI00162676FF|nr:ROK family transcriptional regulator [Listeria booriae]MBC2316325.1 ROK family transcriptional regulator [Listeria booriae]